MSGKICSSCKELKSFECFHKNNLSKDGYEGRCRDCRSEIRSRIKIRIAIQKKKIESIPKVEQVKVVSKSIVVTYPSFEECSAAYQEEIRLKKEGKLKPIEYKGSFGYSKILKVKS